MLWCVLNKENKAVCWPKGFNEEAARRNAKKALKVGRLPQSYRLVPVDMQAVSESLAQSAKENLERQTQEAIAALPLVDPLAEAPSES
jgi:hypothetical protein